MKRGRETTGQGEKGAILVLFAILLFMLIAFVALAVDIGHLAVVRNELQNAADAGALSGAHDLYLGDGTVNPLANQTAYATARLNASEAVAVDIDLSGSNGPDIQRGHWSFSANGGAGKFTPHDSLEPIVLSNFTTEELDVMDGSDGSPPFINAVRVVARREDTPAASFFAQVLGFPFFKASAEAIAYLGFAGELHPGEIDQPITICQSSILNEDGHYTCNIGRLINSASKLDSNTGAWTNYSSGCSEIFSANDLAAIIDYRQDDCDGSNPNTIYLGDGLSVGGGQVGGGFDSFRLCAGFFTQKELEKDPSLLLRDQPWEITVPVIDCDGSSNPSGCLTVVGAVKIKVVMVTSEFPTGDYSDVPPKMGDWDGSHLTGKARWDDFVDAFNLEVRPGIPATDEYFQNTIYATRECEPYETIGKTGGPNFGVLAEIPVLVH